MKPPIVPLGVHHLDIAHELRDIEQTLIKSFPVTLGPVCDLLRFGVEIPSPFFQFLLAQSAKGLKMEHQMVVVAHNGKPSRMAAVTENIVTDDLQQLEMGCGRIQVELA